jgi:hypothetical protein
MEKLNKEENNMRWKDEIKQVKEDERKKRINRNKTIKACRF